MGANVGCCTTRDSETEPAVPSSSAGKSSTAQGSCGAVDGCKKVADAASSPLKSRGVASEPDAEPDEHIAEHHEFIKVLRVQRAKEEDIEFWNLSDLTDAACGKCDQFAIGPKCQAIAQAVSELKAYYREWSSGGHDAFWHRKSHQVVLAVVVCRLDDGTLVPFRGMNTEVSLPAGSLCAERAAIARAASDLRAAHEIVSVAVLDPKDKINPLWPCEVCQSWLAKLRDQNSAICVMAVADSSCEKFVVRINGVLQPRLRPTITPPDWILKLVQLAEDVEERPWEARELIYVDGAWDSPGTEQWALLKAARAKGTHLIAGIHSDDTVKAQLGSICEPFDIRLARLLEDRHVCSVLIDAPWTLSEELVSGLGIRRVVTESKTAERRKKWCTAAYEVARKQGIVETVTLQ